MRFVAVKVDLVHSRRLKNRRGVQENLLRAIRETNRRFASAIAADFVVTHGDECQGLLRESGTSHVFGMIELIIDRMHPVQARFGIGLGTLNTSLQEKAIGMDGPAWHNAKEALEGARRERVAARFRGFGLPADSHSNSPASEDLDFLVDEYLSSLASLLLHVRSRWALDLREITELLEEGRTQAEIATSKGVSAAAVSKRLARAGWREYRDGAQAIRQLLDRLAGSQDSVLADRSGSGRLTSGG